MYEDDDDQAPTGLEGLLADARAMRGEGERRSSNSLSSRPSRDVILDEAEVDGLLSFLPFNLGGAGGATTGAGGGGGIAPAEGQTTTIITESAGTAPEASAAAEEFAAAQIQLAGLTEDLTTGSYSLWPLLLALLALILIARTAWYAGDRGRDRYPTAGFAVDWFRARGQRFATTYLEW